MRVALTTLGCRLNQFETDSMSRLLREAGYEVVEDAPADIHVVNTCTITHQADADARQIIRRIAREQPQCSIVVTGCFATSSADEVRRLEGVRLVVPNGQKGELIAQLKELAAPAEATDSSPPAPAPDFRTRAGGSTPSSAPLSRTFIANGPLDALPPDPHPRRARAYLKVQDGCDYRCSFCIVPMVRGKSRSLSPELLMDQLRELKHAGISEVVLTGVHLGTYGRDLLPRMSLAQLMAKLLDVAGSDCRLRLGSLDPHEVGDDIIDIFSTRGAAVCRHLHLPLQSGNNEVLRDMRRAHTADDFERLVGQLAARVPGIALGSDIIVGFPTESAAAFESTRSLLAALPITYLHVFSYSTRAGTSAARMRDVVSGAEKANRRRTLEAISQQKWRQFADAHTNKTLDAVVHARRHASSGQLVALTDNYLRVWFDGPDSLLRRSIALEITGITADGKGCTGRWHNDGVYGDIVAA